MVKTQRAFILGAAVLSGIGAAISFLSLGTESWISCSECRLPGEKSLQIGVEYGLFKGVLKSYFSKTAYEIEMTCLWDKGVCAQLCAKNAAARQDLLEKLYNGTNDAQLDPNCPHIPLLYQFRNQAPTGTDNSGKFINLGSWFCTILFLVLSAVVGLVATLIAIWNFAANPIEIYFSIFGLYIYNGVALALNVIYIIIFGAHYAQTIRDNLAIQYTIVGAADSYGTVLGWSYWISLVPMICYTGSIVLFYIRQYLINQEPKHNIHPDTTEADPTIYIF